MLHPEKLWYVSKKSFIQNAKFTVYPPSPPLFPTLVSSIQYVYAQHTANTNESLLAFYIITSSVHIGAETARLFYHHV